MLPDHRRDADQMIQPRVGAVELGDLHVGELRDRYRQLPARDIQRSLAALSLEQQSVGRGSLVARLVHVTEGKADVTAIVRVLPNTVMADFSNRLQKGVKEYLEAYAGIQVSRVTVILEALPAESAQEPVQARVR